MIIAIFPAVLKAAIAQSVLAFALPSTARQHKTALSPPEQDQKLKEFAFKIKVTLKKIKVLCVLNAFKKAKLFFFLKQININ